MKETLYEIVDAIQAVSDLDDENITEYLDSLEMQLQVKSENILKLERHLTTQSEVIDAEIKRLQNLKKSYSSKAKNIKDYVQYQMESNGIEKIETPVGNLSLRKTTSVEITDESLLKKEFVVTKTTSKPDKKAIMKALKNGEDVGGGATIRRYKTLLVK